MRIVVREATRNRISEPTFSPSILPHGYQQYFTVGYENGTWVLDVGSFVGIIPCNDGSVIQIEPKVPTKNITYMLIKSGYLNHSLETPFASTVPYQIAEDSIEGFFEALVGSFLVQLDKIRAMGLLKTSYQEMKSNVSGGKINLSEYLRGYPKHYGTHIPRDVFFSTGKNIYNQLLCDCLVYLLSVPLHTIQRLELLNRLAYFAHIVDIPLTEDDRRLVQRSLEHNRLPPTRRYYLTALNLALLILSHTGVDLGERGDVEFRPIILPTDRVFEAYIRNVCRSAFALRGLMVVNGRERPIPFFDEAETNISITPDILIYRGSQIVGVLDMKYKTAPTASDYYQMWSYLEGTGVSIGAFVHVGDATISGVDNTSRRADRTIYSYRFQTTDLALSEQHLLDFIEQDVLFLE